MDVSGGITNSRDFGEKFLGSAEKQNAPGWLLEGGRHSINYIPSSTSSEKQNKTKKQKHPVSIG